MLFNTINCCDTTSNCLWSWLLQRLSQRQSLSTTVLFRTPYPYNHIPPTYEMTPGFKPFTVSSQYKYGKRIWNKTTFLEVIIAQYCSIFNKDLLVANQTFSRDQQTVIYLFCRILWLKSWEWMKLSSRHRQCGKKERTLVNTGIAVKPSKDIGSWVGLQTRKA